MFTEVAKAEQGSHGEQQLLSRRLLFNRLGSQGSAHSLISSPGFLDVPSPSRPFEAGLKVACFSSPWEGNKAGPSSIMSSPTGSGTPLPGLCLTTQ